MPTAAGQRRASIRFERRASVSDGAGNTVGAWAALCGPYAARLRPIVGGESVLQQRLAGLQPFEVSLLACAALRAVTAQDRAVDARTGDVLDIVDIRNPDERGRELVMLVKKGAASG